MDWIYSKGAHSTNVCSVYIYGIENEIERNENVGKRKIERQRETEGEGKEKSELTYKFYIKIYMLIHKHI